MLNIVSSSCPLDLKYRMGNLRPLVRHLIIVTVNLPTDEETGKYNE